MITIYNVITNSGDGSNSVRWVMDAKVIDLMDELADQGDETYASGDGLQVNKLVFPDSFDIDQWLEVNYISLVTFEDMKEEEEE